MAPAHDPDQIALGGFEITGGVARVEEIGTNRPVDRPDIAAQGVAFIGQAFQGAGGDIQIVGPVSFAHPVDPGSDADQILSDLDFSFDPDEHLPD